MRGQIHAIALGTHWVGGWRIPRAVLDDMEKRKFLTVPGLNLLPLGFQAPTVAIPTAPPRFLPGRSSAYGVST
jgi:hypothetical protein